MPRPRKRGVQKLVQNIPCGETLGDTKFSLSIPSHIPNITFTTNLSPPSINNNYVAENTETSKDNIPLERLKLGRTIGEGEFGSVLEGTYLADDGRTIKVAIKTLHNEHFNANRGRDNFLSEAQVMMKLNHHCIVKLIGLSIGCPMLMVQELVPLGSMLTYIIKKQASINPNYEFKIWAAQIACGELNVALHII